MSYRKFKTLTIKRRALEYAEIYLTEYAIYLHLVKNCPLRFSNQTFENFLLSWNHKGKKTKHVMWEHIWGRRRRKLQVQEEMTSLCKLLCAKQDFNCGTQCFIQVHNNPVYKCHIKSERLNNLPRARYLAWYKWI